jgi:hypothetical protein
MIKVDAHHMVIGRVYVVEIKTIERNSFSLPNLKKIKIPGLEQSAGKEDPVEFDSSLTL